MYVRTAVDRAGVRVQVSLRDRAGARRVSLDLHLRGAEAVAAMLTHAARADEDVEIEAIFEGNLEAHSDEAPPPVSD